MGDSSPPRFESFITEAYRAANAAADAGHIGQAWQHLERAHIVAQTSLWPHCRSHRLMLQLAVRLRDSREATGQIVRLASAPLGNLTGRLPIGNTGRANVTAFAPMNENASGPMASP